MKLHRNEGEYEWDDFWTVEDTPIGPVKVCTESLMSYPQGRDAHYPNATVLAEIYRRTRSELKKSNAKLSERKTVHGWLNDKAVVKEEAGKPLCLLRRLAIALGVHAP